MDAQELIRIRKHIGLTQEQLAHKIGCTFCSVNRWENGKYKPSPVFLRKYEKLTRIKKNVIDKHEH